METMKAPSMMNCAIRAGVAALTLVSTGPYPSYARSLDGSANFTCSTR